MSEDDCTYLMSKVLSLEQVYLTENKMSVLHPCLAQHPSIKKLVLVDHEDEDEDDYDDDIR